MQSSPADCRQSGYDRFVTADGEQLSDGFHFATLAEKARKNCVFHEQRDELELELFDRGVLVAEKSIFSRVISIIVSYTLKTIWDQSHQYPRQ